MYSITCHTNGRQYVGMSKHPRQRQQQHATKPPRRMAADVAQFGPFHTGFQFQEESRHNSRAAAQLAEQALIQQRHLTGPRGYNTLPSTPGWSRQYHAMHKQRKMTAWQQSL